jgi:hypothetical protein
MVVGAPWMAVARSHSEADATVKLLRRAETMNGMDDMIDASGHLVSYSCGHFTNEKAVGVSN